MSISVNVTGALVVKFQSEVWVEEEEEEEEEKEEEAEEEEKEEEDESDCLLPMINDCLKLEGGRKSESAITYSYQSSYFYYFIVISR